MPKTKILLVKPKDQADFLNTSIANEALDRSALFPSLSLLTIAALTPRDEFTVEIFDEALGVDFEDCDLTADIYGLTCFDPSRHRAHEICRHLKARGAFVVIGGPHATQHHETIRDEAPYDVVFAGEAEHTWPQFLREWQRGEHKDLYHQTEFVSLEYTPAARYDLCTGDDFLTAVIQTSRGCPYRCEFCDSIVLSGNKVRTKPAEVVLAEIDEVYRQDFVSVLIGDDNFTASRAYAKDVLRRIAEWRRDKDPLFMIAAQVSIDIARDDELCELMVQAGMVFAYIGIESSSEEALRGVKKMQNVASDIPAAVAKLHSYGINVMSGFIVGFDEDGPGIFGQHLDYSKKINVPVCPGYLLMAPAGTPLRERLEADGRIDGAFVSEELFKTNVIPKRMHMEDLLAGFRWMITQLFETKGFARRLEEKFKIFRSRGLRPNGARTLAVRRRHAKLLWQISSYCLKHPRAATEITEPLLTILPTMLKRPALMMDVFNDLLLYVRIKSYYKKAGMFAEALLDTPRPENWIEELDRAAEKAA